MYTFVWAIVPPLRGVSTNHDHTFPGYLFWDEEVVCTDFETCEKDCVDDEHKIKSGAGSLASSMNMMVFVAGVFYLLPC